MTLSHSPLNWMYSPSGSSGSDRSARTCSPITATRRRVSLSLSEMNRPRVVKYWADLLVLVRRADDLRRRDLRAGADLPLRLHDRRDRLEAVDAVANQVVVGFREPRDAPREISLARRERRYRDAVRAEARELLADHGAQALNDRDHRDDRGDADHDAERRQKAAEAMRANRRERRARALGGREPERVPRLDDGPRRADRGAQCSVRPRSLRRSSKTLPSFKRTMRWPCAATSGSCVTTMIVCPSSVQLVEQGEDLDARLRIEIAGRLVGEQDRRVRDERARDRDALPLTARELVRQVMRAIGEADALEHALGLGLALGEAHAAIDQRLHDVLQRRSARQQVEALEDEADLLIADVGELVLVQAADVASRSARSGPTSAYRGSR